MYRGSARTACLAIFPAIARALGKRILRNALKLHKLEDVDTVTVGAEGQIRRRWGNLHVCFLGAGR